MPHVHAVWLDAGGVVRVARGPGIRVAPAPCTLYLDAGMLVADDIRKKLGTLPHKPGIYLMRDRFGTVIYVGKARDLRKRVGHYFQPSRRLGWDLKFKALIEAIHDFDFHVVRSEPEALLLEGKLIKEFQRQLPRRQALPHAQGQLERPHPALHADAPEAG
jgi:GIY-YIG catalytic domain